MIGWRGVHNLLAATALVGALGGYALTLRWSRGAEQALVAGHVWAALPAIPLVAAMLWLGRRQWLRRPRATGWGALNGWTSRVAGVLLMGALATGLWVWAAEHPRTLIRARQLHQLASEALAPALGLHLVLGLWLRARRRARMARSTH